MREAVVVASARTGLAKAERGSLNMTRPDDQAAHCIKSALAKVPELDPAEVDDVYLGCANPSGAHGSNMGRMAAMLAGLPATTGGATINRHCSSGLNAVALAAYSIMNDGVDVAIGGGSESVTFSAKFPGPGAPAQEAVRHLDNPGDAHTRQNEAPAGNGLRPVRHDCRAPHGASDDS